MRPYVILSAEPLIVHDLRLPAVANHSALSTSQRSVLLRRYSDEDCLKSLGEIEVQLASGLDGPSACRAVFKACSH